MKGVKFDVQSRKSLGSRNTNRLRKEKRMVPGVVYGFGKENESVQMGLVEIEKLYYTAGESTVVNLCIDGGETQEVLIHSIEMDPVKNEVSHVDFKRIDPNKKVHTLVNLKYVGNSEGVRIGGILIINKNEVEIECLPKHLVHDIEVDISALNEIGAHLSIADINVPEGITFLGNPEVIIAHIEAPRKLADEASETEAGEEQEQEQEEEKEKEGEKKE